MKKTQQKKKHRGGKTQKRRGGKTQKRRGEMKRKVMMGGVVYTKEKGDLIKRLGVRIEQVHRSLSNVFSTESAEIIIDGKNFYVKKNIYEPNTFDSYQTQKKILYNYAVEFDYECDSNGGRNCPFVVYFENLDNCIKAINEYYGLTPTLLSTEIIFREVH